MFSLVVDSVVLLEVVLGLVSCELLPVFLDWVEFGLVFVADLVELVL